MPTLLFLYEASAKIAGSCLLAQSMASSLPEMVPIGSFVQGGMQYGSMDSRPSSGRASNFIIKVCSGETNGYSAVGQLQRR